MSSFPFVQFVLYRVAVCALPCCPADSSSVQNLLSLFVLIGKLNDTDDEYRWIDFTLTRIFMKLFRTGSPVTVNECQVNFGFLPAKYQILIRTVKFL